MNRRLALSGIPVLVFAACTAPGPTANAEAVFAQIQFLLPTVRVLALGIAIAVPQSAVIVAQVAPYLDQAAAAFQGLSATTDAVKALPVVQQIESYAKAAVDAVANLVNTAAPGSKLAQFAPAVAEAQAVLALITAFAQGVQARPMAGARVMALPMLHR